MRPTPPKSDSENRRREIGGAIDQVSIASGTIVSADGLIVTMNDGRENGEYSVTLGEGRELAARLLVDDRRSGLILLKVNAAGLPFLMPLNPPPQIGEEVTWTYSIGAKTAQRPEGSSPPRGVSCRGWEPICCNSTAKSPTGAPAGRSSMSRDILWELSRSAGSPLLSGSVLPSRHQQCRLCSMSVGERGQSSWSAASSESF